MGKVVAVQPFCALEQTVEFYEIVVTCLCSGIRVSTLRMLRLCACLPVCSECPCVHVRVPNYHMLIVSVMGACSQQAGEESSESESGVWDEMQQSTMTSFEGSSRPSCVASPLFFFFFKSRKGRGFRSVEFLASDDPRQ